MVIFDFELSLNGYTAGPNYAISATPSTSADEGTSVVYNITSNRPDTQITVNLSGISAADIVGSMTRTVTLDATGAGTFTVQLVEDVATEGPEILTATIAATGQSVSVTINDTSTAPPVEPGTIPTIVQSAVAGNAAGTGTTAPITVALPQPATAGHLLVLFLMSDKASGGYNAPSGFVMRGEHTAGTGVSGAIYTKLAVGGEQSFDFSTNVGCLTAGYIIESDASVLGEAALGLASVSTTSRTSTATANVGENSLVIASWHNDTGSTTQSATSLYFGPDWEVEDASQITPTYPLLTGTTTAPAWLIARRDITTAQQVTATFLYTGGSSDENMVMMVSLQNPV